MKIIKYIFLTILALIIIGVIAYFLGPKMEFEKVDGKMTFTEIPLLELDDLVKAKDANTPNLKDKCAAEIIWNNDTIQQTEYAVVFLHGFSACAFEGNPIVNDFAKEFGYNLYLHRFPEHGLNDDESFKTITPKDWIESGKEAINIGRNLGKKVIVMSSSTGGTVSTFLAAENPDAIAAQFLYSPNFEIANPASSLMNDQWGFQILKNVEGGEYHYIKGMSEESAPFWTTTYRIEGLIALQDLIEQTMTDETFKKVKTPTFIGYYYKNEEEKDNIISIDKIKTAFDLFQTPDDKKVLVPFSEVGGHVITNVFQKGGLDDVRKATFEVGRVFLPDLLPKGKRLK
jgi:esterase/lipase